MYKNLYVLPVCVNFIAIIFYCIEASGIWNSGSVSLMQLLLNAIVFPTFLIYISIKCLKELKITVLKATVRSVAVVLTDSLISYVLWGIRWKKFFSPDSMTIGITLYIETLLPITLIIVSFLLYWIFKKCDQREHTQGRK